MVKCQLQCIEKFLAFLLENTNSDMNPSKETTYYEFNQQHATWYPGKLKNIGETRERSVIFKAMHPCAAN